MLPNDATRADEAHRHFPGTAGADDLAQALDKKWYVPLKIAVELIAAFCLLVLSAPLILVCAVLVKLTSRGPAFYSQTRLGQYGRPYRIYKLRTMYDNCESRSGPQWSRAGDSRITPLGRFLRRAHLDELPQLWNVLRGDMCLIGPRPERPEFVPGLEEALPLYRGRMLLRPGVTGLAQVQLPADTDLDSVRRKLAYDLFYVRNASPWLDCRILASTALKVFGASFQLLRTAFLFPCREAIEGSYRNLVATEDMVAPAAQPQLATAP